MSSLSQHSELAGRVVSRVYCGTESFLKETENKKQQHFRSLSCLPIMVWVGASPCLYNLYCTAREHLLVGAQCVPCCSFSVSRPYVQQTLPTKAHTHTLVHHQSQTIKQSYSAASKIKLDQTSKTGRRMQILYLPRYAQKCPLFSTYGCSAPVEYKHCTGETLHESRVLVLHCTMSPLTLKICKWKGPGDLLVSPLKITAGYISVSLSLSFRPETPLQLMLLHPSNEIMN